MNYRSVITGLLMSLLLVSCTLESKFGLPNDEKINPDLVGEWYVEKHDNERIKILENGKKAYKLVLEENEKTYELDLYSKTINGFHILNLVDVDNNKITNIFYGFKLDGNILTISEVNDKLVKEDFQSESELLEFFQKNISREDFFTDPATLIRR